MHEMQYHERLWPRKQITVVPNQIVQKKKIVYQIKAMNKKRHFKKKLQHNSTKKKKKKNFLRKK